MYHTYEKNGRIYKKFINGLLIVTHTFSANGQETVINNMQILTDRLNAELVEVEKLLQESLIYNDIVGKIQYMKRAKNIKRKLENLL